MAMRWERVQQRGGSGGPGVRWGHTCNAIRGGKLLYVFGGYGKDQCQTNQVHVFDTGLFLTPPPPSLYLLFIIFHVAFLGFLSYYFGALFLGVYRYLEFIAVLFQYLFVLSISDL